MNEEDKQEHHHHWQLMLLIVVGVMTLIWGNMRTSRKWAEAKRSIVPTDYVRVTIVCDKSNNLYVCTSNGVIHPVGHRTTATGEFSSELKHAAY